MGKVILFKIVFTTITLGILFFQLALWKRLRPHAERTRFYKLYRTLFFALLVVTQSILWFAIVYPGRGLSSTFPAWYLPIHGVLLAFNYSHFFWMLPFGLFWLLRRVVSRVLRRSPGADGNGLERRRSDHAEDVALSISASEVSRFDFLSRASVALHLIPAATGVAAVSGMFFGSKEIWVNEKSIRIRGLHDDLKGLRFAQLSDIHVGNLIGEKILHFTLDRLRASKIDGVIITGDIIDNNNVFLPIVQKFFSDLNTQWPGQVFGVMGNHDYIDDGPTAQKAFELAGLTLLMNDAKMLVRGRGKLLIAGLDYPPLRQNRLNGMKENWRQVQTKVRPGVPIILLNHHPSDFEFLKTQKIDLVLSGHTHGGQIAFSKNRESLANGARWLYKYYVDHYVEGDAQLYVNRGLGHWFPLRIDCPPEITIFTLS